MPKAGDHTVIIERRGRSHQAHCRCGWSGHAWNELRPAEADAWHHVHGDSCIVDTAPVNLREAAFQLGVPQASQMPTLDASIERLVTRARIIADGSSPYSDQAVAELRKLAGEDGSIVQAAIAEVGELLRKHSLQSKSTADGEWLQLRTAKRLLEEILTQVEALQ